MPEVDPAAEHRRGAVPHGHGRAVLVLKVRGEDALLRAQRVEPLLGVALTDLGS